MLVRKTLGHLTGIALASLVAGCGSEAKNPEDIAIPVDPDPGDVVVAHVITSSVLATAELVRLDRATTGLRIAHASPNQGLAGSFTDHGRTVFFQTIRTAAAPDVVARYGKTVEIAGRFVDQDGRTMHWLFDGHVPKAWQAELGRVDPLDPELRQVDLALARRASAALASAVTDARMAPEVTRLTSVARQAAPVVDVTNSEQEGAPITQTYCYGELYYGSTFPVYKQHIVVRAKDFFGARHSATYTRRYGLYSKGGQWYLLTSFDHSNHGTSALDMTGTICSGWGPYATTPDSPGSCDSGTNYSYGADGGHSCNSDSRQQITEVDRNGAGLQSWCYEFSTTEPGFCASYGNPDGLCTTEP